MAEHSNLAVEQVRCSDVQLVLLAQGGDHQAMECLLDRYRSVVEASARDYFWAGADDEDIVQEGMIGLYKAVGDYMPEANMSFRSFARLCIRRQIISALKAATRHKHALLNSSVSIAEPVRGSEEFMMLAETLADGGSSDPERIVISRHIWANIRQLALSALSQLEWRALINYIGGAQYQDIAEQFGYNIKQIDNALQRAKKKIVRQATVEMTN